MVQMTASSKGFSLPPPDRLFHPEEAPSVVFPIQSVQIDWDGLVAKRPSILDTVDTIPAYLLKPGILVLLDAAKHPTHRLILDLMRTTDVQVPKVFALKTASFIDDDYDFCMALRKPTRWLGRHTKTHLNAIYPSPITLLKIVFRVTSIRDISRKQSEFFQCVARQ